MFNERITPFVRYRTAHSAFRASSSVLRTHAIESALADDESWLASHARLNFFHTSSRRENTALGPKVSIHAFGRVREPMSRSRVGRRVQSIVRFAQATSVLSIEVRNASSPHLE